MRADARPTRTGYLRSYRLDHFSVLGHTSVRKVQLCYFLKLKLSLLNNLNFKFVNLL